MTHLCVFLLSCHTHVTTCEMHISLHISHRLGRNPKLSLVFRKRNIAPSFRLEYWLVSILWRCLSTGSCPKTLLCVILTLTQLQIRLFYNQIPGVPKLFWFKPPSVLKVFHAPPPSTVLGSQVTNCKKWRNMKIEESLEIMYFWEINCQ
jgi:hypothetical protein